MPTLSEKRLAQLLEKERAHDDYLAAIREVRAAKARIDMAILSGVSPVRDGRQYLAGVETDRAYALGYSQAMTDFAVAIVNAANARQDLVE